MSTASRGPASPDPQFDRELRALKSWRDNAVRTGRIRMGAIKDTDLSAVVRRARKHLPAVQNELHGSVKHLAEEIIQVQLQAVAPDPGQPGTDLPSRDSRAPTRPSPIQPVPSSRQEQPQRTNADASEQSRPVAADATRPAPASGRVSPAADLEYLRTEIEPRFAPTAALPARAAKVGLIRLAVVPGGLRLRWPAPADPDPVTLLRVVARDDVAPWSPAGCSLVDTMREATSAESAVSTVDSRPPGSALRFFAVFEHRGASLNEAYEAPPTLVAEGTYVFGVGELEIREEDGLVIGRWQAAPGVTRVLVYRIPLDQLVVGVVPDHGFLLDPGDPPDPHLGGFVDETATPGQRYRYDIVVEVVRGGVTLQSDPVSAEVAVSAPLVPITDLEVTKRYAADGSARFDVAWTKPAAGQVLLFRTEKGPVAGATNGVHERGVLASQLGLHDEDEQHMPLVPMGPGREGMRDVRGKTDWSRIYFTPVTLVNHQIRVGDTRTLLVIGEPTQPEVVERCDHQVLKFGWPSGAAKVIVAPRGVSDPVIVPTGGPGYDEIDKDTYDRLGALQFRLRLPPPGCAVHLAGVAFEAGGAEYGRPVSAPYPGLLRIWYGIETRQRLFRVDKVVVRVSAETQPVPIPAFVLVHRADRLPLHLYDGEPLPVTPDTPEVSQPTRQFRPERLPSDGSGIGWVADVRGLSGYLRLFVSRGTRNLALLDPAPHLLRLRG
jgi:hypothetical protein